MDCFKTVKERICRVCENLNIELIAAQNKKHNWKIINKDGQFDSLQYLPSGLCDVEDLIEKKR